MDSFRQKGCGQREIIHGERGKERGLGWRVLGISSVGGGDAMAVTRRVLRDRRRGRRRWGRRRADVGAANGTGFGTGQWQVGRLLHGPNC
jgi:hypothetical protein